MAGSRLEAAPGLELAVVGAGVLGFVSSLLPWYGSTTTVFGFTGSVTVNAWNAGASAWLSVVLLMAAGAVALMGVLNKTRPVPAWYALLPAGLSTVAALCLVGRWASWSDDSGGVDGRSGVEFSGSGWLDGLVKASAGPEIGIYLALVAVVVALVASWLAARAALASP